MLGGIAKATRLCAASAGIANSLRRASTNRLTLETMNPRMRDVRYAVRGGILTQAMKMEKKLKEQRSAGKASPYPFEELIYCNIGNPQSLEQRPLTFVRQVIAGVEYPALLDMNVFPADVCSRARKYLDESPNGTGPYTHSQGNPVVRQEVADFINRRDNTTDADPDSIFLSNGASDSVQSFLQVLLRDENDGLMIPIPQYPIYSALCPLLGGSIIPYYLDEETGWSVNAQSLRDGVAASDAQPRALVVINPGNPTGQCLDVNTMEEIVQFCASNDIVLMADEVYQENIYDSNTQFRSFRSVLKSMGPSVGNVQLASMHSVSKGFIGECGKRGGYTEYLNFDDDIIGQLYKSQSIRLCSNATGQLAENDESYELYAKERGDILESLKRRALKVVSALNSLEGVVCQPASGSMYAFPNVTIPKKACDAANEKGVAPDYLYCEDLLLATGIVVVPGSGFLQREGTFHFRTTFLPPEHSIDNFVERIAEFHQAWMAKYK